jgi:RNA polymerase sigma-70 factor (ECF subfamily)
MENIAPNLETRRREFLTVYQTIENDLVRLSRRLCLGNEDRAQDLLQDMLVKAYVASIEGKLDGTTAKAWFMRILTNLFINDYRHRKKWEADIDYDTVTSSGESGPEKSHANALDVPGAALIANALDEELEAALSQLTEPLHVTVTLVDMQGLEYSEAAQILGVPIGTVRSRLARARMQLHDLLQEFAKKRGLMQAGKGAKQ